MIINMNIHVILGPLAAKKQHTCLLRENIV